MLYLSGVVRPDIPVMLTPHMWNRFPEGVLWAADSGRFASPHKYTDESYLAWLAKRDPSRCLFATAPDIVGDATGTLMLSAPMYARIRALGYPVALVAQDGLELLREFIPWNDFDALFIGGSTAWKLSESAAGLAAAARERGKWVHMGRVNSLRRLRHAASIGCDSVDGTHLAFGPDIGLERVTRWLATHHATPMLWEDGQ